MRVSLSDCVSHLTVLVQAAAYASPRLDRECVRRPFFTVLGHSLRGLLLDTQLALIPAAQFADRELQSYGEALAERQRPIQPLGDQTAHFFTRRHWRCSSVSR